MKMGTTTTQGDASHHPISILFDYYECTKCMLFFYNFSFFLLLLCMNNFPTFLFLKNLISYFKIKNFCIFLFKLCRNGVSIIQMRSKMRRCIALKLFILMGTLEFPDKCVEFSSIFPSRILHSKHKY